LRQKKKYEGFYSLTDEIEGFLIIKDVYGDMKKKGGKIMFARVTSIHVKTEYIEEVIKIYKESVVPACLLYTSPSPRD